MNIPLFRTLAGHAGKRIACLILGVATFSQTARSIPSYQAATLADSPLAFWQLNETGDASTGTLPALDATGNGYNGTYGATSQNGFNFWVGPQPPDYLGFTNGQGALVVNASDVSSPVALPALNLNTNAVTITMWINPSANEPASAGLLMNRTATDAAGFGFGTTLQAGTGTMPALGYTWNTNNGNTYNFNSGLFPVASIWQFVAVVIQPNSATIYLYYTNSGSGQLVLSSAVNAIAHTPESFAAGATYIGSDISGAAPDSTRVFAGSIAGVAVYKQALTKDQILALFAAGVGVSGFPPSITTQPLSQYVHPGSQVQLSASGISGTTPINYQWKFNNTDVNLLPDSTNFVGAQSNVLTILNMTAGDAGPYHVVLNNSVGTTVSSNGVLTLQTANLVGQWFDGTDASTNLIDLSGHSAAGTHDGYTVGGTSYMFTNDVPFGKTGQSLWLYNGDTGISISNTATSDANYTNSFDDQINDSFTVGCFAKGWPTSWSPFVSKFGETAAPAGGWQLRQNGSDGVSPCWTVRGSGGTLVMGSAVYNNPEDLAATGAPVGSDTTHWHHYAGTFDASTGVRSLYVDGVLWAQESNNVPYSLAPDSHLCIGARDAHGTIANFFTGEIYDVRLYNYALNATQVLAWVGVTPPTVSVQPQSQGVFSGVSAQMSIVASGTPPLTYQWQLNGTDVDLLPDSTNFTGINSNKLTVLSVSPSDVGSYHVKVTSTLGYGSVTSSNAVLSIVPRALIGEWFTNGTLSELSQYRPAGTHDAYFVGGGNYAFVTDVPPGESGQSIQFTSTDTGMAISNSATSDGAYTNTFEVAEMSVAFWAKGRGPFGGNWHAWVAKDGYNNNGEYDGLGWSVGIEAWSQHVYFDMEGIDGGGIGYTMGDGLWGNGILESSPQALPPDDNWHHYASTFSPSTGIRRLYYDGNMVAEQTGDQPYHQAPDKHLTISCQEQTTTGMTGFQQGTMFDVRFYNYALTASQVAALLPDPVITGEPPQAQNAYVGVTTRLRAIPLTHSTPVTNHWQLNGTNLVDGVYGGATISGSGSSVLTLANVTTNLQGTYRLIVSDPRGMTISSNTVITVLPTSPVPAPNLVGAWLTGAPTLADVSGYQPAGTHDGYGVAGTGTPAFGYAFTNDVPSGTTGQSLTFRGNTALAISNSSTLDLNYTNTFDDTIDTNGMTVMLWAKGLPGAWNPWLSKYGEGGAGWQLRVNGDSATPCWTIRGTGGAEDMSSILGQSDGNWHHYTGTYDPITGIRNLYVDGVLSATQSGQGPLNDSSASHLVIGARDGGGNAFGNYFAGEIYDVRIYDTALSEAQVNSTLIPIAGPMFSGPPILSGDKFILSWASGSLLESTNLTGPWTPTGATSPYTNIITSAPQMYFRLSTP